ncbi:hypothetical protein [Nocardia farcinica]|uniref:hypothetical protein n=1 Tax=Nocardia farcinica TaxID=37329 RepID=UPI002456B93C|nr:hypothetical protein [Nocardia farcinica]
MAAPTAQRAVHPNIDPAVARSFTRLTALAFLAFGAVHGLLTVLGGQARWSAPAYEVALQIPGAPESWGAVLLAASLLGLIGCAARLLPVIMAGFAGCAVWATCFALCVGIVAARNPGVGWGGVVTWTFLAIMYAACTAAGARRFHAPT